MSPQRNEIVRHHVHRIKTAELRTGKVRGFNHGRPRQFLSPSKQRRFSPRGSSLFAVFSWEWSPHILRKTEKHCKRSQNRRDIDRNPPSVIEIFPICLIAIHGGSVSHRVCKTVLPPTTLQSLASTSTFLFLHRVRSLIVAYDEQGLPIRPENEAF